MRLSLQTALLAAWGLGVLLTLIASEIGDRLFARTIAADSCGPEGCDVGPWPLRRPVYFGCSSGACSVESMGDAQTWWRVAVAAGLLTVLVAIGLGFVRLLRAEPPDAARRPGRRLPAWLTGVGVVVVSAFVLLVVVDTALPAIDPTFFVPPVFAGPAATG